MLVLAGKIHHLGHFGLSHLVRVDATHAPAAMVDLEHDASRFLASLVEETLENVHDKLHWCVVVVQQQYFVEAWLLGLGPGLGNQTGLAVLVAIEAVLPGHPKSSLSCAEHRKIRAAPRNLIGRILATAGERSQTPPLSERSAYGDGITMFEQGGVKCDKKWPARWRAHGPSVRSQDRKCFRSGLAACAQRAPLSAFSTGL